MCSARVGGLRSYKTEFFLYTEGQHGASQDRPAVLVKTDVGVKSKRPLPAGRFALNMNQLGRGNRCISFSYHIPVAVAVKITLHDLQGREIQTLVNAKKAAGSYRVKWNGTSRAGNKVSAGIYFCRMTAPGFVTTQKMILR